MRVEVKLLAFDHVYKQGIREGIGTRARFSLHAVAERDVGSHQYKANWKK